MKQGLRHPPVLDKNFRVSVRVYYEDTDSGGVVYYAGYLRFMERARTEWLRSLGFESRRLASEQRVLFAVSRITVDYLAPARLDDLLRVSVRLMRSGQASLGLAQEVSRDPGEVLCRGDVRIACLDSDSLRPRAIPQFIRAELERDD